MFLSRRARVIWLAKRKKEQSTASRTRPLSGTNGNEACAWIHSTKPLERRGQIWGGVEGKRTYEENVIAQIHGRVLGYTNAPTQAYPSKWSRRYSYEGYYMCCTLYTIVYSSGNLIVGGARQYYNNEARHFSECQLHWICKELRMLLARRNLQISLYIHIYMYIIVNTWIYVYSIPKVCIPRCILEGVVKLSIPPSLPPFAISLVQGMKGGAFRGSFISGY